MPVKSTRNPFTMQLRALRYLTAVVEAGSFAGTAVQLGVNG
jgi:DNA-binding transcriptional LysR family regulator